MFDTATLEIVGAQRVLQRREGLTREEIDELTSYGDVFGRDVIEPGSLDIHRRLRDYSRRGVLDEAIDIRAEHLGKLLSQFTLFKLGPEDAMDILEELNSYGRLYSVDRSRDLDVGARTYVCVHLMKYANPKFRLNNFDEDLEVVRDIEDRFGLDLTDEVDCILEARRL